MSKEQIEMFVDSMEPEQAVSAIASIMKKLWPVLDEGIRVKFVRSLVGESGQDNLASLVHL
jgi:hypothetical protein